MDSSKSDDSKTQQSAESATRLDRRKFLGTVAATAGGLLLGDLASSDGAHAQSGQKFTEWGWPQPYDLAGEQRLVADQRRVDRRLVGRGDDQQHPAAGEAAGKARHRCQMAKLRRGRLFE
ncbi:MAG: twin-arginine translocation signal domain-containing protein [Betaproteobacteria bacterium]|nr:MAG: twin-arginine translocation signal domain-containing protein [Betaproteobacteria bacterium]